MTILDTFEPGTQATARPGLASGSEGAGGGLFRDAANARADAAEREVVFWKKAAKNLGDERIVESNRADAAERDLRESREVAARNATDCAHLRQSAITLETEREQLAARVTELEQMAKGDRDAMWKVIDDLAAAKAKIAELETERDHKRGPRRAR